jgi:hypothetical protein
LEDCFCCQEGSGAIEDDDEGISPTLVSLEWSSSVLR